MSLITLQMVFWSVGLILEVWIGAVYLKIAKSEWPHKKVDGLFFTMMSLIAFGGAMFMGVEIFVLSGLSL